jgi:hypothetical protein
MPQPSSADFYDDADPSALTDFQTALAPYGSWFNDPTYGTVWAPARAAVGSGFQPYVTAGHWAYDNGWTWLSDYPWGWATFHYGRWVWVPAVGWAWVPGREYAGAWVDWRVGDGYVGWAPRPPEWIWRDGLAASVTVAPPAPYVFAPRQDLFARRLSPYVVTGSAYWNRTAPYRQEAPPAYAGRPIVTGPAPTTLGIPPARVVRPPVADPGLRRAITFARPATAVRLGARPPAVIQQQPYRSGSTSVQPPLARPQPPSPAPRVAPPQGVTTPQAPGRPPAARPSVRPSGSVNTAPPAHPQQ